MAPRARDEAHGDDEREVDLTPGFLDGAASWTNGSADTPLGIANRLARNRERLHGF